MLKHWKDLAFTPDIRDVYVLNVLAGKPSAFYSGNKFVFWQWWIYVCDQLRTLYYLKPSKVPLI